MARNKQFNNRDRFDKEKQLPKRVLIPQAIIDKLASPAVMQSVKDKFSESRNAELDAWETLQQAIRAQTRAIAAYQNSVSNFKVAWEEIRSDSAVKKTGGS
ncbi:hypothetical protein EAE96_001254 [Botrytis aclada]|nr:hypothetical protein EAE96_001254 [Botrytis aclada]